jgi:t-SNARE complex subunit (syntaxin)
MIQLLQKEHHDNLTELERLKSDVVKTKLEEFSPVTAVSETDYQKLKKQLEEAQAQIIQLEQKRLHSVERNLPGFINSSVTQKR